MKLSACPAFIFDFDGTLVDSRADLATSMNYSLKKLGYPEKSFETLVSYIGGGRDEFIGLAFETDDSDLKERALGIFNKHYSEHCTDQTYLYPKAESVLNQLKEKSQLFILSNKPVSFIRPILNHFSLTDCFQEILGQYSLASVKPDPEGILHIIEKYKLKPERTYMIGDHHTDMEAGKNAGIQTIYCQYGFGSPSNTADPDHSISGLEEMLQFTC